MISRLLFLILVISIFLPLLAIDNALAARQSILMLGNLRQSVELDYLITANSYKNYSNRQQSTAERYNVSLDYAVVAPQLLIGNISLSLEADQYSASGSGSGKGYDNKYKALYDVKATLMGKSPIPINLQAQSQVQDVHTPYSGGYQNYYDFYGASATIRNRLLPVTLNFTRSTSRTEGLSQDRETTHEEASLYAQHSAGISRTNLEIRHYSDDFSYTNLSGVDVNRTNDFQLTNNLFWDNAGLSRNLNSVARSREDSGVNSGQYISWQESLSWDLGRALRAGGSYSLNSTRTPGADQENQAGNVWIRHLLYQSLSTQLQGNVRKVTFDNGSEKEANGKISLDYRKTLPEGSSLGLYSYWQYGETDRTTSDFRRPVVDEAHTVVFGQTIPLDNLNYLPHTIIIRNANNLIRVQPYREGIDYQVVQIGPQTEIVVSGPGLSTDIIDDSLLPGGDRLLISYQFQIASDIRFSTTVRGVGGDVNLFNGLYRFYIKMDEYSQDELSRDASTLGLGHQATYTAAFEFRNKKTFATALYNKIEGSFINMQSIDAMVSHNDIWGPGDATLFLKNSYRWYDAVNGVQRDSNDTFSAGGTYRRPIILNGLMTLTANYEKYLGDTDTDRLALGGQFNWTFRKLVLSLSTRASFSRVGDNTSHVEHLRLHLIRYF